MAELPRIQRVYVVVDVIAGVATEAYTFAELEAAQDCLKRLSETRDLAEDDVQLFETQLDGSPCKSNDDEG